MGNNFCCQSMGSTTSFQSNMTNKATHRIIQHRVNDVNISITQGSIFNEHVDAIVIVTNTKLKPSSQTAKELRTLAGPSMHDEITKLLLQQGGRLSHGQVVYSHSGDLDYDFIFYAVLPSCSDSSQMINGSTVFGRTASSEFQPSNSLLDNLKNQSNIFSVYNDTHGGSKHEKQHIFECWLKIKQNILRLIIQVQNLLHFLLCNQFHHNCHYHLFQQQHLLLSKLMSINLSLDRLILSILQLLKHQQCICLNETPNMPTRQSHYQQTDINLGLGDKHDSVDFMKDIDADDYIRFGHALERDSEIKENPNNVSL